MYIDYKMKSKKRKPGIGSAVHGHLGGDPVLQSHRPEDVPVRRGDDDRQGDGEEPRPSRAAPDGGAEGKPDGDETIDGRQDDQPGGEVQREEEKEERCLADDIGDVQQFEVGHQTDPCLETADVENAQVGEREDRQVEIHGRGSHVRSDQNGNRHDVADGTDEDDRRQSPLQ